MIKQRKKRNKIKDRASLRWVISQSKNQKWSMAALLVSNAVAAVLSVVFAFAMKGIIDNAVAGVASGLVSYAVLIGLVVLFQFVFRIITQALAEYIRGKLEMNYKSHIFSQVLKKKQDKISAYHSGEIINRLTADVNVVADGASNILPTVVSAVTRLISAVVALVLLDWIFAIAFTIAGLLVFLVISMLRGKLKTLHKRAHETDGKVRSFMQECIENLLAVKVFAVSGRVEKRSKDLQEENFKVKMRRRNYAVIGNATYNFIFSAGYIFALIYGGVKILAKTLSYGSLTAILQLVNNVQVPFMLLSGIVPKYYAMLASAERLMEIEDVEDEPRAQEFDVNDCYEKLKGISVENVVFSYDRDRVLKNASTYINKGDFVMISGPSGVGKSTLIKLLLGVYPLEEGKISLDTTGGSLPVDCTTRPLFTYVPQGNMIFSGTLRDNVTFIKDNATEEEINRALEISECASFLSLLPKGLDTVVGEGGMGLSEGQVQRIAIARAVLSDAPVLLLDEATSALDEQTEGKVLSNLKNIPNVTLIIVTHKKAAEKICNRKIKVKDGVFVEE